MAIETKPGKLMRRSAISVFDHIYQVYMFRIKGKANYADEIPPHKVDWKTFTCNCRKIVARTLKCKQQVSCCLILDYCHLRN